MPTAERKMRQQADRLEARVSRETKALCQRAATIEGRSLTNFVVNSALEAAKRTIRDSEFLDLSQRDRTAFVEALLQPAPPPNARLLKAVARYKELVGKG